MDAQVLKAQKWVNATYATRTGYTTCPEDGLTGWGTIHSLTRALQIEIGASPPSDAFGPTTLAKLTALGDIQSSTSNTNIKTIVEGALYCKGYSGGSLDGSFNVSTLAGIASLQADMGFSSSAFSNRLTAKMIKALLTMDAYVLLPAGRSATRTMQRWLNSTYIGRADFFIIPCDGLFSRGVQQALVRGIQYSLGAADGAADGIFGPNTKSGLQANGTVSIGSADTGSKHFVQLFKAALTFNGRTPDLGTTTYTTETAAQTLSFQQFVQLPQTSSGDYQTWASLLVSTGDADRKGKAMDCRTPFNAARAAAVKAAGYETVGRYLTGAVDKTLTVTEISTIFAAGLRLFPIYQTTGNVLSYFSYDAGKIAGKAASDAARGYGIPDETVIYFACDYDATSDEIISNIIPHFRGVRQGIADGGGHYAVGIYGSRNVCSQVSSATLAISSFVSGMSTGFSGNLGFPLPQNWAFDQIKNLTLASGTSGQVEIDNDIRSGRDLGISSLTATPTPNDTFYTCLTWLEARAQEYFIDVSTTLSRPNLVAQYLRTRATDPVGKYEGPGFGTVAGEMNSSWIEYVNSAHPGVPALGVLQDPDTHFATDIAHLGASINAVVKHGLPSDLTEVNLADFGSWAGDLITAATDFINSGLPDSEAFNYSLDHIAGRGAEGLFKIGDFYADIDSIVLGDAIRTNGDWRLSELIKGYYRTATASQRRFDDFYEVRFNSSPETLYAASISTFFQNGDIVFWTLRNLLFENKTGLVYGAHDTRFAPIFVDVARAFQATVDQYAS